jgi:hypothetical protein
MLFLQKICIYRAPGSVEDSTTTLSSQPTIATATKTSYTRDIRGGYPPSTSPTVY